MATSDDFDNASLGSNWTQMPPPPGHSYIRQRWYDTDHMRLMIPLSPPVTQSYGVSSPPYTDLIDRARALGANIGDTAVGHYRREGDAFVLDPATVEVHAPAAND
jgi:hypothetical protein